MTESVVASAGDALRTPSPEAVAEALARHKAGLPYHRAGVESGLFDNDPRIKMLGNSVTLDKGATGAVLDFAADVTSDTRGVIVQLQAERANPASLFADNAVEMNVIAEVRWGADGGQQSAQVSIGQGITFALCAQFVRVFVKNPLADDALRVVGSAAPGVYAPFEGLSRLVNVQGAMPLVLGPFAPAQLVDGASGLFQVPPFARSVDYAALSMTGSAVDPTTRLLLSFLANSDSALGVLRIEAIGPESYPSPYTPGTYLNVWQLDRIPVPPAANGLRIDVTPSGSRFSGVHKLGFRLSL